MKKLTAYIVIVALLAAFIPLQALAQGAADTVSFVQKLAFNQNKNDKSSQAALSIKEPEQKKEKKKDKDIKEISVRNSEITLNEGLNDNYEDFLYGHSVYYNLLKEAGRLDLLGKDIKEIDRELSSDEKQTVRNVIYGKKDGKNRKTKEQTAVLPGVDIHDTDIPRSDETNRFIVKYKPGEKENGRSQIAAALLDNQERLKQKRHPNIDVLVTDEKTNPAELLAKLKENEADSGIESIQPDYQVHLSSNDPYFDLQWGLYNQQSAVADSIHNGFRIDANVVPAWDISLGDEVIIAVIDTGVDIAHEDISPNIWQNSGEIADNGADDDGNGYIDDINGWNFAQENNIIHDPDSGSDEMHGTNVAGVISAVADNDAGIAGVAPDAKIMPLKVFSNGTAYTSDIIEAIEYAQSMGAKIVNCSWGASGENTALQEAMADKDMLFVCAAGNNSKDIDANFVSPASFALPNVIAVASMNEKGFLSAFSNYGINSAAVAAPGENIIAPAPGGVYVTCSGTSMAAAFVSGEAALILGASGDYNSSDLRAEIVNSSDHLSSLLDKVYLGNKINAGNAVTGIYPDPADIVKIEGEPEEPPAPGEETEAGDFFELYSTAAGEKAWYNTLVGPSAVNGINHPKYSAWENFQEIISPQTGDLTLKQADITLPGRNGLDLEIGRIYQSDLSLFGDRQIGGDATSYNDYSTYYLSRYALGTGWSFTFPSVEIKEDEGAKELYYHTGSGPKYHVRFTEDPADSNLEDYYKKDVVFNNDTGYSNGQVTSAYSLTTSDKTKRYFAADGRLLGIKDRFGNEIVFKHVEKPVTNIAPNNDFEYAETIGIWGVTGRYSYDQTAGKDDTTALKFSSTSSTSNSCFSSYIPVVGNTKYYLAGYIKNQLSGGTTGLSYREYDLSFNEIKQGTVQNASAGDWQLKEQEFTTSSNAKYLRIEFKHTSAVGTSRLDKVRLDRAWPLISEITDSIGRKITFSYTDTLYDENAADAGTITVTVTDPEQENSYSFCYTRGKWLVNYNWPTWSEQRRYPVLDQVEHLVANSDKDTAYDYTEFDEKFSFTSKNTSGTYQNSKRPLLNQVILRNSRVNYEYGLTTKHLGEEGFYETHRITNRHEQQETSTGYDANEINTQTYIYSGTYDGTDYDNETGYPGPYSLADDPEFLFTSTMQQTNGLKTEKTFKGKKEYKTVKHNTSSGK